MKTEDELMDQIDWELSGGVCPVCGFGFLNYNENEITNDFMYYSWDCGECGAIGLEAYEMTYTGHCDVVPDLDMYNRMLIRQRKEKLDKINEMI